MRSTTAGPSHNYFGESQFRLAAAVIGALLLSVPYVILPGAFYALLILLYFPLCWFTFGRLLACLLMALHVYQISVCYLDGRDLWEFMDLNSQLMAQNAMALLVLSLVVLRRRWLLLIAAFIVWVGVGAAAIEWRGFDLISHLPSRAAVSLTTIGGSVTYGAVDVRLRGVYAESSALGAVLGGLAFMLFAGAIAEWKKNARVLAVISIVSGGVGLLGLIFVLTKAGIAVVFAGFVAFLLALPFALGRTGVILAGAVMFSTLIVGSLTYSALPVESKEYVLSEIESVQSLFAGGDVSAVKGKGVYGRTEGFSIAASSLINKPLGGAPSGIMDVVQNRQVMITEEMMFYFNNGVFGLKSALANIAARGGVVGLLLLGLLVFYAFDLPATMRQRGVLLLQASMFIAMTLAFYIVIEDRYFYFAFTFLLAGVHRHLLLEKEEVGRIIPASPRAMPGMRGRPGNASLARQ